MSVTAKPKNKAKNALVVYAEPGRIEYVALNYAKGEKGIGDAKAAVVDRDEPAPSALKRLRIGERGRKDTDLILFLSKEYYQFQKGFYPESLGDELEKILEYSMAENLFYDSEKQCWVLGEPDPVGGSLKVPMYSMESEQADAFRDALGAENFKSFVIAPVSLGLARLAAMTGGSGLGGGKGDVEPPSYACIGRLGAGGSLSAHLFSSGSPVDSMAGAKGGNAVKMLAWTLRSLGQDVHLFFSPDEKVARPGKKSALPMECHALTKPYVHYLAGSVLDMDRIAGFDSAIQLKKWRIPLAAWLVVLLVIAYAGFGYMQSEELEGLRMEAAQTVKVLNGLKKEWEPVDKRRKELDGLSEQAAELMERDVPKVNALKLLTILTEYTPKDTWLKQIYLKGNVLTLTGESGDALQYRTILSNSEFFTDVKFASTVHHIAAENKDRFTLKARVVPEAFEDVR